MSKKAAETTIKTSIRIRPCSEKEKEQYPGPSLVQAAHGEVRLYSKCSLNANGSGKGTGGGARETSPGGIKRPNTPISRPGTPNAGASAAAQAVWQAVALQHQMGSDYQSYPFANVFGPEVGNEEVYSGSGCRDIVEAVLGGCNGTIFVYGQTGAGKTHTMDAFMQQVLEQLYAAAARDDSNCEISITLSAVELYNEVLRCLLSGRENLQLRMGVGPGPGATAGVVLEGAEEQACRTWQQAAALVEQAKAARSVGETRANARSSRSHLIVRIKVEALQLDGKGGDGTGPASVSFSLLNLVDLAGSERVDKSGSGDTPLRLREALNINKSLLCLGNVVTALAERSEGKRNTHIPYRDSKLTRLLEDSLGGNAATALLACITPLPEWHLEQTRQTLEFAARAARVVCSPQRNVLNLLPNPGVSADSSALIAQLQAEVAQLKALLAQHQDGPQELLPGSTGGTGSTGCTAAAGLGGKLQSNTWDSCSSTSSGAMAEAAVAAEAAAAADGSAAAAAGANPVSPRSRAKWTNRLRLSVGGTAAARAAAAAAAAAAAGAGGTGNTAAGQAAAADSAAPNGSTSSTAGSTAQHRHTASHGSLLWKFFHSKSASIEKLPTLTEGADVGCGSASLKSTGLLMLSTGAKRSSNSSAGGSGVGTVAAFSTGPGALSRWSTFHNGSSSSSYLNTLNGSGGLVVRASESGKLRSSSCGGGAGSQVASGYSRYSSRAAGSSGGGSTASSYLEGGGGLSGAGTQAAAAEAAMALRDHIIKQLVTALQQKKAEIKALRDQQAVLQRQLEAAEGEGAASKQKLRELAEGIQALAAAREEEFEKWKGHLDSVEVALYAAQQESLTYRQEALALVQQLTQLQARYRSLQSDQLRRSSLLQSANQSMLLGSNQSHYEIAQLHTAAAQQANQLQQCLATLGTIEGCLRQLLAHTAAPLAHTGAAAAAAADGSSSAGGSSSGSMLSAASQISQASSASKCTPDISSHMIQTVSTRFDMSSGLVTRVAMGSTTGGTAGGTTVAQLEDALAKLKGVIPLLRNAAATVGAAAGPVPSAAGAAAAAVAARAAAAKEGVGREGSSLSTIVSCGGAESEDSCVVRVVAPVTPPKCDKCDAIKPLLALMQKLKDEVAQLRANVKAKDAALTAAAASSATLKRDLEESRQQVGSLQERIDELAEELETARAAAAAAAASAYAAAAAAEEAAGAKDNKLTPAGAPAAAGSACVSPRDAAAAAGGGVGGGGQLESPGTQLSREGSCSKLPLMSADAPLAELHAQILMSWHVLAMPRTYRAAFVLGHGASPESSPWWDRAQCQAHVALLACLHQLQEDQPVAAATQQSILAEEAALLDAGLRNLPRREFDVLVQQWSVHDSADAAAQGSSLLAKLWAPCGAAAAGQLAAASAAACRQCLAAAPPIEMVALTIRSNASLMAATSNALAEAAS